MYVFLIIIIPLVYLVNRLLCRNGNIGREQALCLFGGIVIACIYTLIDFFAVGSNHQWINTVGSVWGFSLFKETVLPIVVCLLPVLFAKDTLRVRIQYAFPVLAAFYAVFLPYTILSGAPVPDIFMLVLYPLTIAAMLFNFDTAAAVFAENADMDDRLWLRCVIAGVAVLSGLLLPTLFKAYWFLNRAGVLTWVFLGLYVVVAPGLFFLAKYFLPASSDK